MTVGGTVLQEHKDHGSFFRCQTAPWKYSYMLGGMVSLCSLAMCLRTISEYRKRSPQMRQCHWSRAKMYGRHSELFGSSLGLGILIISRWRALRRNHNPKSKPLSSAGYMFVTSSEAHGNGVIVQICALLI